MNNILTRFTYGYPGDGIISIHDLWRQQTGFNKPPVPTHVTNQAIFNGLLKFGAALFGPIGGYNLTLILIFAINFATTYYLIKKLLDNKGIAAVAALTYAFSLYNLWQTMQHPELALGAGWLPLYILALINLGNTLFQEKPFGLKILNPKGWGMRVFPGGVFQRGLHTASPAILAALAFALVFLSSFYIGYFALFLTAGFLLIKFARMQYASDKGIKERVRNTSLFLAFCFLFSVFCLIFTLPGTFDHLRYRLGNPEKLAQTDVRFQTMQQTFQDVKKRPYEEVIAFGTRPWDYLIPSIFHPVYGKYVEPFYQWLEKTGGDFRFISPYLPERMNYIPITIWLLAGYAIFRSTREVLRNRTGTSPKHTNVFMFALLALWMFAVSMPSFFFVGPIRIYFPSHYLFKFLPVFRIYARAGIFVLLCTTILAAYGLKFLTDALSKRYPKPAQKRLLAHSWLLIATLILFENLNFPPFHLLDLSQTPEVYTWLAEQPEELTIVEYPRDTEPGGGCTSNVDPEVRKDFCPSCSLYFQTVHQKSLFTGDSLEPDDRQTIADLANPQTHQILSANGVDLIIVHTADPFPQKNPLDSCQSRRIMNKPEKVTAGLKLIEKFEGAVVYEVLP